MTASPSYGVTEAQCAKNREETYRILGFNLKKRRKLLGVTLHDVALTVGAAEETIRRYEMGVTCPSRPLAAALRAAFQSNQKGVDQEFDYRLLKEDVPADRETRKRMLERALGFDLRTVREAEGWTQTALAEEVGVVKSAVSHWESGNAVPYLDTHEKLRKMFSAALKPVRKGRKSIEIKKTARRGVDIEFAASSSAPTMGPEIRREIEKDRRLKLAKTRRLLGFSLRAARIEAGLSRSALAERVGVSSQAAGMWELGISVPSANTCESLRQIFLGKPRKDKEDRTNKMRILAVEPVNTFAHEGVPLEPEFAEVTG